MREDLRNIISAVLRDETVEFYMEDNLRDDLGMSSLQLAELSIRLEDAFGKDIFANGILNTIKEIEECINE